MLLFTAKWCAPCASLKDWISKQEGIQEVIEYVDIDENIEVAKTNGIRGIPTLIDGDRIFVGNENIRPHLTEVMNG